MIQISATACLNFYYDILQIADKSRKNINYAGESQPAFFRPVTPCDFTHSSEKHSSRTVADFDVLFSINVTNPCGYCKGKTFLIIGRSAKIQFLHSSGFLLKIRLPVADNCGMGSE